MRFEVGLPVLSELHSAWYSVVITCLGIVALVVLLYKGRPGSSSNCEEKTDHNKFNFCSNPSCLRCSNTSSYCTKSYYNEIIRENTYEVPRLEEYFSETATLQTGKQRPTVFKLPGLETTPFVSSKLYEEDVALLQSNVDVIMKEFLAIEREKSSLNGWKINSTPSGSWSVFYLFNQGNEVYENTFKCPATATVVESLPSFMRNCAFGNACFSVVQPGTIISEHYGPCNVRLRCHLGLRTSNAWKLHVDSVTRTWTPSNCIVFDDSFLHSVTHTSDHTAHEQSRAIFMVDLWHYNVTADEQSVISQLFPFH